MNETKKIRIGFVGTGAMGQAAHLRNYMMVPNCEVVAVAEVKEELARSVASRWGIPSVYPDHEAMLASESLDGIVASQPFSRHGTLVPELLKAGVPILTEKPIAGSVAMGESIVEAVEQSATWMMIGYHKRSDPATILAKSEIDKLRKSGELGQLTYIRLLMPAGDWIASGFNQNLSSNDPNPELFWDPPADDLDTESETAYTDFVNYYIHQINLVRHLLGESWQVNFADKRGVLLAGTSDSGVTCSIEMSPYTTSIDWQESALVCFEHGWVKLELPAPLAFARPGRVEIFRDPAGQHTPKTEIPQLPWVHAMWQQAQHFVDAIAGKRESLCSAHDALEDIRLAREYIRLKLGK